MSLTTKVFNESLLKDTLPMSHQNESQNRPSINSRIKENSFPVMNNPKKIIGSETAIKSELISKSCHKVCLQDTEESIPGSVEKVLFENPKKSTNHNLEKQNFQNNDPKAKALGFIKLFIGGVPPKMQTSDLIELYLNEVKKIKEYPKRSEIVYCASHNGFAFLSVTNINEMNMKGYLKRINMCYDGRKFDVRIAVDRQTSLNETFSKQNCKLLIHGLTNKLTNVELEKYFTRFGPIDKAYVAYCPVSGKNKGFGFVMYMCKEVAEKVASIKEHTIEGVNVIVKRNKGNKKAQGEVSGPLNNNLETGKDFYAQENGQIYGYDNVYYGNQHHEHNYYPEQGVYGDSFSNPYMYQGQSQQGHLNNQYQYQQYECHQGHVNNRYQYQQYESQLSYYDYPNQYYQGYYSGDSDTAYYQEYNGESDYYRTNNNYGYHTHAHPDAQEKKTAYHNESHQGYGPEEYDYYMLYKQQGYMTAEGQEVQNDNYLQGYCTNHYDHSSFNY